jgi:hypothetical protein
MAKKRRTKVRRTKKRYTRNTAHVTRRSRLRLSKQRPLYRQPERLLDTYSSVVVKTRRVRNTRLTPTKPAEKSAVRKRLVVKVLDDVKKLPHCVKRQQRKEVIHAKKHAGKFGQRRPKWTKLSKIRC